MNGSNRSTQLLLTAVAILLAGDLTLHLGAIARAAAPAPQAGSPAPRAFSDLRVQVRESDGDAQVMLADATGRPRIRLSVDGTGNARIVMLQDDGRATELLGSVSTAAH